MNCFQNLKLIEDRENFNENSIFFIFWKDFNVIIIEPVQAFDYFDVFDRFDLKHNVESLLIYSMNFKAKTQCQSINFFLILHKIKNFWKDYTFYKILDHLSEISWENFFLPGVSQRP